MALILKKLYYAYSWIFRDLADPRSDGYILVESPLAPFLIMTGYLYFSKKLGPKLMENRKPFEILNIIRGYNVIQIIANAYVVALTGNLVYHMDWNCAPVDYGDSILAKRAHHVTYVFYLLKILDLTDTLFFILRKSYRQVSFLHVYHHVMMVLCIWIGSKYVAGGECMWVGLFNGTVHVFMYLYYLLATIDVKWKAVKYKKMLTQLQMVQFTALILIFGRLLFKPDCSFPKFISYTFVPQIVLVFCMFLEFYVKTYMGDNKNK